ncbi:unannotated protein [freshwater metagenome]|uniref:Unannotated protein n=1 Tax=freshwater metagenome TaxID=449393 RepID=A0A6J7IGF9_9ZZZZ
MGGELVGEQVLDLRSNVDDEARERTGGLRDGGVADEDPEAVGVAVDVVEQGQTRLFEECPGAAAGEGIADGPEQVVHLPVDDNGVQTLLAAEVLVDHRLGDAGFRGDLLDRDDLKALVGKEFSSDVKELLPTLLAAHPDPADRSRPPRFAPMCAREIGDVSERAFVGLLSV